MARREWGLGVRGGQSGWLAVALICLVALIVRCIGADSRPFEYDELYHMLAGRSWAAGQGVAIAGGEYQRVHLYTAATGLSIRAFGWTPLAARLPAIIAGALVVGLAFAWVRGVAGQRAAWIAAILMCFSYRLVDLSQLARFYTWHVLAVWIFATQTYALVTRWNELRLGERAVRGLLAAAALLMAVYIQATTVIAVIAIGLWGGSVIARSLRLNPWSRGLWLAVGAGVLGLLLVMLVGRHMLVGAVHAFRSTAVWAEAGSNRPTFYYSLLLGSYGWMLNLFPAAVLLAYGGWRRPTLFCLAMVVVALGLHSLAGMKSDRYISYIDPFILVIWALALDRLITPVGQLIARPFRGLPMRLAMPVAAGVGAIVVASAAIGVPMYRATLSQLATVARGGAALAGADEADNENIDWKPYLPVLRPLANTSMLVTADDLRALRYLGGYDLLLNRTVMWDFTQAEFGRDPRTGGHGITDAASLAKLMSCYPSGTILSSNRRWRSSDVTAEAADFIERTAQPVPLPAGLRMHGFVWHGPDRRATPACRGLVDLLGDRRHGQGERLVALGA